MKKVKTIILSLIMVCASAFISACSCGGDDTPVVQIPAENIYIECVESKTDKGVTFTNYREEGIVDIICHVGEQFTIRYDLTPATTTMTQVMFDFSKDGLVETAREMSNSMNRAVSGEVSFVAKRRTSDNYKTVLTFTAKNGAVENEKKAIVNISVYDPVAALPILSTPKSIRYDIESGKLLWENISTVIENGVEVPADVVGDVAVGLAGYSVEVTNIDNPSDVTVQTVKSNEMTGLKKGVNYSIKIKALGDELSAVSSEYSEAFRFRQIADPTDIANNNGRVSYTVSESNVENRLYYKLDDNKTYEMTTGSYYDMVNVENFSTLDEFDVSVQTFPSNYNETLKYAEQLLSDNETVVFVYPSNKTETINIRKLITPVIDIENTRVESLTVGGQVFTSIEDGNKAFSGAKLIWENTYYPIDCNVKYSYKIYKDSAMSTPIKTGVTTDSFIKIVDLQSALSVGNYILKIEVQGEASKIIPSELVTFEFSVLPEIKTAAILSNNLEIADVASGLSGVELFFVSTNANADIKKTNSTRRFVSQSGNTQVIDLSTLEIAPDTYDIYARFVGKYDPVNYASTIIGAMSSIKLNSNPVQILSAPINPTLDPMGNASFDIAANAEGYRMVLTKNNSDVTYDIDSFITVNENKATFNIYDVYEEMHQLLDTLETPDSFWVSGCSFVLRLITLGDGSNTINSSVSKQVMFSRHDVARNVSISTTTDKVTQDLRKTISFSVDRLDQINNGLNVSAKVGDVEIAPEKVTFAKQSVDNSFDIPDSLMSKIKNELDKTNENLSVYIFLELIGWNAVGDTEGKLNSNKYQAVFTVASTPTNPTINAAGDLSWVTTEVETDDKFRIIYSYIDDEDENKEKSIVNVISLSNEKLTIDTDLNTYTYNIQSTLAKIPNKIVTITVEHWSDGKLTDVASDERFAQQLGAPTGLAWANTGYSVVWESPTNEDDSNSTIGYVFKVESDVADFAPQGFTALTDGEDNVVDGDGNPIYVKDLTSTTFEIPLSGAGAWGIGQYRFSVMTKSSSQGTGIDKNHPYILNSVYTTKLIVNIIDGVVTPTTSGDLLTWNPIIAGENTVSYTLKYGADNTVAKSVSDITEIEYNVNKDTFFTGLSCYFQVVPFIDYSTTGYILIGDSEIKQISKLAVVETPVINDGVMTFTKVPNATGYEIFINNSTEPLDTAKYELTNDSTEIYTILLKESYTTDTKIQIKAKTNKENTISSSLSSVKQFTKLESVQNFKKDGGWLTFSPVTNANYYEITVTDAAGETLVTLKMVYDANTWKYGEFDSENNIWNYIENNNIFKMYGKGDSAIFQYKFDVGNISTDTDKTYIKNAQDYNFTIYANFKGDNTSILKSDMTLLTITKVKTLDNSGATKQVVIAGIPEADPENPVDSSSAGQIMITEYMSGGTHNPIEYSYEIKQFVGTDTNKIYSANKYMSENHEFYILNESTTPVYGFTNANYFTFDSSASVFKFKNTLYSGTATVKAYTSDNTESDVTTTLDGSYLTWPATTGAVKYVVTDENSKAYNLYVHLDIYTGNTIYVIEDLDRFTYDTEKAKFIAKATDFADLSSYPMRSNIDKGSVSVEEISITIDENPVNYMAWSPIGASYTSERIPFTGSFDNIDINNIATIAVPVVVGQDPESGENLYENTYPYLTFLNAGNFEIKFNFYGDGVNSLDSDKSAAIDFIKLGATVVGVNQGELELSNVGAEIYRLYIKSGVEVVGTYDVPAVVGASTKVDLATVCAGAIQPETDYVVEVLSFKDGCLGSQLSKAFTFRQMATPTNLQVSECSDTKKPIVKWSSRYASNGQQFEISISEADVIEITDIFTPNGILQYSLRTDVAISGADSITKDIKVRIIGSTTTGNDNFGYISSNYAITKVKYIKDVLGVKVQNGQVSWNEVEGAYSYIVKVYDNSDRLIDVIYTSGNSYDFDGLMKEYANAGYYKVQVNALTNPFTAIVSTDPDTVAQYTNIITTFKPTVISDLKVKDGMLNWTIDLNDNLIQHINILKAESSLSAFGWGDDPAQDTIVKDVVTYIKKVINGGTKDDSVDSILSYLYKANLDISGYSVNAIPTEMIIWDEDDEEISAEANYSNARKLEFSFFVGNEPPKIIDPETDGEGEETDPTDPVTNPIGEDNQPETTPNFAGGLYSIRLSTIGNSSATSPVVASGYSAPLVAYKPLTPKTRLSSGADILLGDVLWDLVVSHETTSSETKYYDTYAFDAKLATGKKISIEVNSSQYIVNNTNKFQASRALVDMFQAGGNANNSVIMDTQYNLFIYVKGTVDSTAPGFTGIPYLNSNSALFNEKFGFLSAPTTKFNNNVWVSDSKLQWNYHPDAGSTATTVSIDGAIQLDPKKDPTVFDGSYDETITFGYDENNNRDNEFTLTNNSKYLPGNYKFKLKNLGNNKGIIDSEEVEIAQIMKKLSQPQKLGSSWIGQVAATGGMFVWDAVEGANAYHIAVYDKSSDTERERMIAYTTNTYYDLPSGTQSALFDLNSDGYTYFIKVTACVVDDHSSLHDNIAENDVYDISNNYFNSDLNTTDDFSRISLPSDIEINDDGVVSWNGLISDTNIRQFLVKYMTDDFSAVEATDNNTTSFVLPDTFTGVVTVAINARSVVEPCNYLNSGYMSPPFTVTRALDPVVKVIEGNYDWNNGSVPYTDASLTVDNKTPKIFTPSDPAFLTYYTDLTKLIELGLATEETLHNYLKTYKYTDDIKIYSESEHEFSIYYKGGLVGSGDEQTKYIKSNTYGLTATKLFAPTPTTTTFRKYDSNTEQNIPYSSIKWEPVPNAGGYRIVIFAGSEIEPKVFVLDADKLSTATFGSDIEFILDTDFASGQEEARNYLYLSLNGYINELYQDSKIGENGVDLKVFIQTLGSSYNAPVYVENSKVEHTNDLYLSSSYSSKLDIAVPPMVSSITYDASTGIVSWNWKTMSDKIFNIELVTEYNVTASKETLLNYWYPSANITNLTNIATDGSDTTFDISEMMYTNDNKTLSPYAYVDAKVDKSGIYMRQIKVTESSGEYTIAVTDSIFLLSSDYENKTPTEYKITSIGTDYVFTVTSLAGTIDTQFKSTSVSTAGSVETYNFELFGEGDGSEYYPYTVNTNTRFGYVRLFTDRHFDITENISYNNNWETVLTDFTGSIDGNDYIVSNINIEQTSNGNDIVFALFNNNKGTIKNIKFELNIVSNSTNYTNLSVYAAGIAITNDGTIDNVHIISGKINETDYTSEIKLELGMTNGLGVGGLVVINNGNITNSSVNANITGIDSSSTPANVAGIAAVNRNGGVIATTSYNGKVIGNTVAGIAARNEGTIDRVFVTDTAIIQVTNRINDAQGYKHATAGGIVAMLNTGAKVTNSYSLATINLDTISSSDNYKVYVGGLIGSISITSGNPDDTVVKNNYVVLKVSKENGSNTDYVTIYAMMPENDYVTFADNYYINSEADVSTGEGEQCMNETELESDLSVLTDESGFIYVIDDSANTYPTHNL